ncbi:hypothetical protein J7E81_19835 [Bacillus sp. ISL-18]|uniref:hypothetical protein n=1 Tax=Bacillus sp. ISL-18 TaxID=2819118 RepID=UPI001BE73497|nr:hypothetical protein [Bacillus sp. ISL-18]MBT2657453.1 hypothetical protein [Bacillus sp. ISL-18]
MMKGWNRFKASKDFLEWFGELAGDQIIVKLCQSEAFVQAGVEGKSVVEFATKGKAAEATLEMVNTVRKALDVPNE